LAQIASLRKEQDEAITARPPLVQAAANLKKELQDIAKQIKTSAVSCYATSFTVG
jgi:hypothetical protein